MRSLLPPFAEIAGEPPLESGKFLKVIPSTFYLESMDSFEDHSVCFLQASGDEEEIRSLVVPPALLPKVLGRAFPS
jgi:hypothetical protein